MVGDSEERICNYVRNSAKFLRDLERAKRIRENHVDHTLDELTAHFVRSYLFAEFFIESHMPATHYPNYASSYAGEDKSWCSRVGSIFCKIVTGY